VRILYLCHRIPYPPDKGDKIRAFHQLRAIAAQHEVDLFTLADQPEDIACQETLRQYSKHVTVARLAPVLGRLRALPFLLTRKALTLPYFYSTDLAAAVHRSLQTRSYDRIFVYCSSMAQYVSGVKGIPIMIDLVDVDSDKWAQYAKFSTFPFSAIYRREGRALQRYEREISRRSSCVLVTTEREAQLMRQITDSVAVHVLPNGVDTNYFDSAAVPMERTVPTVIFTGDMSYFPNQEAVTFFAHQVLPLIRRSVTDTRFLIVGRNPGKKVLQLRKIDGVEVTGFVPDVRTYLAKAHVAVAPFSIAAGIQNKILEAMAFGLPVVATSRTRQGISPEVGRLVATGDSAQELSSEIVALLRDPQLATRKGIEGRQSVMAVYQWQTSLGRLLQLLENPGGPELVVPPSSVSAGRQQGVEAELLL
jgi:sugar transferase (PEP-CTERM/EpsH1 system associated)